MRVGWYDDDSADLPQIVVSPVPAEKLWTTGDARSASQYLVFDVKKKKVDLTRDGCTKHYGWFLRTAQAILKTARRELLLPVSIQAYELCGKGSEIVNKYLQS